MLKIGKELESNRDLAERERKLTLNKENIMLKIESIYVSCREKADMRKREEKNYQNLFCEDYVWGYFDNVKCFLKFVLAF